MTQCLLFGAKPTEGCKVLFARVGLPSLRKPD